MITEDQQVTPAATTIEAADAIAQAIQRYIDGMARGDQALLADAFHPEAHMYGAVGAQRFDVPITEFTKIVVDSPADAGRTFRARITAIAQVDDVACATVIEEGFWGTLSFVDLLTLCRMEDRWRIVSKTFAHTGGEPPAMH